MSDDNAIYLGVNIDHVATLRQARGTRYPEPIQAALVAEQAGADSITMHLREDRRHIQDRDVERLIDTLQGLQGARALLIATHRLSAIRRADRIIVLQRGRIVAAGNHDDLVRNGGYYAETAQMQAVTEALDAA